MNQKLSIYIIIILHAVGIVGSLIPATSDLTISLTPVNLLLSSLLLIYHSRARNIYTFLILAFLIGMLIEIIGVQTGWPFGSYSYGTVLGPKIIGVPVIIGINWFMLTYAVGVTVHGFLKNKMIAVLVSSSLMVGLDLIIEPVAIKLGYWQWVNISIPISNYIAWWFISLIILIALQWLIKHDQNKVAIPLIISQMAYFVSILIFY